MNINEVYKKAEEIANKYNPEGVSPFPFDKIIDNEEDLNGIFLVKLADNISGAIIYEKEKGAFSIFVNKEKSTNRNHFTTAHELGHYFLHKEMVKKQETVIDDGDTFGGNPGMYRNDNCLSTETEKEANNFAATLIMPKELVIKAWKALGNVEECSKIFNVSVSAMSIRLERLKLIN